MEEREHIEAKAATVTPSVIVKELIFAALALISLGLLIFEIDHYIDYQTRPWLGVIDLTIAFIFLADFLLGLITAGNKKLFWKHRWYELLAALPIPTVFGESLRTIRILRLIDVLSVVRVGRLSARLHRLADFTHDFVAFQLFQLASIVMVIIFTAAVAFYEVEHAVNQNVKTLFDAFYWAMSTTSTVGYGDIVPQTTEGRVIAMLLMVVGIGTVSSVFVLLSRYLFRSRFHE